MPQTESVTDLVNDLLAHTVVERLLVVVYLTAVRRHPQTVSRDDTSLAVQVGETEDEVALAVEDVGIGDSEILVAPTDLLGDADETLGVVLSAPLVVRLFWNGLLQADKDIRVVPLLQNFTRGFDHAVGETSDRNHVDTHDKRLAVTHNKACVEGRRDALVGFVRENYTEGARLVEVGVGRRDDTARALVDAGFDVTATDTDEVETDERVEFARDDVTSPDISVYEGASLVYSLRPPYEIHEYIDRVARSVGADTLLFPLADEGTPLERNFELVNRDGYAFFVRRS